MDRDVADSFAFAVDPQVPLRAERRTSSTSRPTISLIRASVERGECKGLVARRGAALDGSQVAQLVALAEGCTRCRCQELEPGGAGCCEVAADVKVVDRGERLLREHDASEPPAPL